MFVLILGILVALADQASKQWIRWTMVPGDSVTIVPFFFNLTYLRNTGAAWGILGGQNSFLILLSIVMLLLMIAFRRSFISDTWEHRFALAFLIGGIIGNILDRVRLGWVTDFLDFHWHMHHWPAFNLADSAICIGAVIYVISALWVAGHPLNDKRLRTPKNNSPG